MDSGEPTQNLLLGTHLFGLAIIRQHLPLACFQPPLVYLLALLEKLSFVLLCDLHELQGVEDQVFLDPVVQL